MSETWKAVVGFESTCEVSESGIVRECATGIVLRQRFLKGYPGVTIPGAPRNKRLFTVHSIVAAAFIGPRPQDKQVNHKDGIKAHNHWENLEYVTLQENIQHSCASLGNWFRGEENPAAKLTSEQVREIRAEYIPRVMGCHRLAKRYGVTKRMIQNIIQGKNWAQA